MRDAIDIFSPQMLENPYSVYAELRAKAPVCKVGPLGWWALSRYDDALYVLKNPELFSSVQSAEMRKSVRHERLAEDLEFLGETSMVASDPPVHTRLRKLINTAFTPRAIARLEARIRALASGLIDDIARRRAFDLMEALAVPLPVIVISEMLGVDTARRADFKRWSDDILTGLRFYDIDEREVDRLIESRRQFLDYFRQMIEARRREPREDLMSDLVRAEVEQEMLSADEVLSMTLLLMVAGNETTTNLMGNAMTLLFEHPGELARLRAEPALIPGMLEETLRYRSPVRMLTRSTTREVTIRGVTIPKGEVVVLLLDAANRDPDHFPDPDRFDITRPPASHLSFGYGIHFCVGAPLARLEAKVAFEELFRRLPPFSRKEGPLAWNKTFSLRGLSALPIAFD